MIKQTHRETRTLTEFVTSVIFMSLQDHAQGKTFKKGVPKEEISRNSAKHRDAKKMKTGVVGKVREGGVVGEAETGDQRTDGRGGEDTLGHPQRHAAPCPRAPHDELHLLGLGG